MSDAALRQRDRRQSWAQPGSRHDRVVRLAKWALPVAAVLVLILLAVAPFDRRGDVSFILDKNDVDTAKERMWVESARYTGADALGRPFLITAQRAIQPSSDVPLVAIEGMAARLEMDGGPLSIGAGKGSYDLDAGKVKVDGEVGLTGPDGYRLQTRDVTIDLKQRNLVSEGPVSGEMELGRFSAGRISADLNARTVTLSGGARLKIQQGAVR